MNAICTLGIMATVASLFLVNVFLCACATLSWKEDYGSEDDPQYTDLRLLRRGVRMLFGAYILLFIGAALIVAFALSIRP